MFKLGNLYYTLCILENVSCEMSFINQIRSLSLYFKYKIDYVCQYSFAIVEPNYVQIIQLIN